MGQNWNDRVFLNRVGTVISAVERDGFANVIEAARAGVGELPSGHEAFEASVMAALDVMEKALAEHDAEALIEKGRQERRAEAERIARETPVTNVRIRITKRYPFKGGHVMERGEEYDVERRISAEYDVNTREWTPEVMYSYYPPNQKGPGRHGYAIGADGAREI